MVIGIIIFGSTVLQQVILVICSYMMRILQNIILKIVRENIILLKNNMNDQRVSMEYIIINHRIFITRFVQAFRSFLNKLCLTSLR